MDCYTDELHRGTEPIELELGPILSKSVDSAGIWVMKSLVEKHHFPIDVVGKTIKFWVTELMAKVFKGFCVNSPINCVGELAQMVGILVFFMWDPNRVKQNVVLHTYLKICSAMCWRCTRRLPLLMMRAAL